jgi:hypothetical protein
MDYTKFFDERPTHPTRPAEYQAAMDAADAAWSEYNAYVDQVFDGRDATETKPDQWAKLNVLLTTANAAEDAKAQAYREWMTGEAEYVREPSQYDEHAGAFLP